MNSSEGSWAHPLDSHKPSRDPVLHESGFKIDVSALQLQLLARLTSLKELQLPTYNPPAGALAPALSALTSLTKLFIRHPQEPEQQVLPTTLRELVVARQHTGPCNCWLRRITMQASERPEPLLPLHISHLTALETLQVLDSDHSEAAVGKHGIGDYEQMLWDVYPSMLPAQSVLPESLRHVIVRAVPDVRAQPLLGLTSLHTLTIENLDSTTMLPKQLLALTQLTSLTRVNFRGRLSTSEEASYVQAMRALPVSVTLWNHSNPDAGLRTIMPS